MSIHASSMDLQVRTNLEPIRFDAPEAAPSMEVVADWTTGLPVFKGKRMMLHLIRDTASASVRDISASAIKEVSHSPDVAELVRTQSTDLASGTILEVRATSEQADDRIEGRVRSWLHLLRPGDAGTPSTTGGGPAA